MINEQQKKLGEALAAAKVLTEEQLADAMEKASKKNSPSLIVGLLDAGHLTFKVFEKFLASSFGTRATIIGNRKIRPDILSLVPTNLLLVNFIFPIEVRLMGEGKSLVLGMVDPLNSEAIETIKKSSQMRIIPVLISLPDFRQAVKSHFGEKGKEIVLEGTNVSPTDEKVVLIRPGGYEEEIAFASQNEKTRVKELTKTIARSEIDIEGFSSSSRSATRTIFYIGENVSKFKEEILAKLELSGSDAKIFNRDTYSREVLYKELQEVSLKRLETVYPKLTPNMLFESLANALIDKGILTRREVMVSCAISYLFGEIKD